MKFSFKLVMFVYDSVVQTFEGNDPHDLYIKARGWLPRYASHGPVTLFEYSALTNAWRILPHEWQDWSHSLIAP